MKSLATIGAVAGTAFFLFKTKKGEYGYGDKFLGITVPQTRLLVSKYWKLLSTEELCSLIINEYHEIRLCGLLVLVNKYKKSVDIKERFSILNLYLKYQRMFFQ